MTKKISVRIDDNCPLAKRPEGLDKNLSFRTFERELQEFMEGWGVNKLVAFLVDTAVNSK